MEHPFTTFTNILRQQVIEPIEYAVQSFDPEQPNYNPPLQEALYSKKLVPVADRTTKREALTITDTGINFALNNRNLTSLDEFIFFKNLEIINRYSFKLCTNLTSVTIPQKVSALYSDTFYFCSSLEVVNIPDNVRAIDDYSFGSCGNLRSVSFGSGLSYLSSMAFYNCILLEEFVVSPSNQNFYSDSNGVLYDKNMSTIVRFPSNLNIANYSIPNGVTTIGARCFNNNQHIVNLTLPSTIRTIGFNATNEFVNLQSIICPIETPPSTQTLKNMSNVTLYVPSQSVDTYKNNSAWNVFKEILPIEE